MTTPRRVVVVAIGIDRYDELQRLSCCALDADGFSDALRQKFPKADVTVRGSGSQVDDLTWESLTGLLDAVADNRLGNADLVIFYFAGHGYSDAGRDWFACSNTERANNSKALATDTIISKLAATGAGTAILVADACRVPVSRGPSVFSEFTAEHARRRGVIAFFGCSPGEVCQELPAIRNGVFTHALLKALLELRIGTPLHIDTYVLHEVTRICTENNLGRQTPYTCALPIQKAALDIFTGEFVAVGGEERKLCVVLTGPSCSGKTVIGQRVAQALAATHAEMSAYAWRRMEKAVGYTGTIQDFMEQRVWPERGKATIAEELVTSVPNLNRIVVCGPRTVEEMDVLRQAGWDCMAFFVYANLRARYKRYLETAKPEWYGISYEDFLRRDYRELGWGLASIGAGTGVEMVINEGGVDEAVQRILRTKALGAWLGAGEQGAASEGGPETGSPA